LQYRNRTVKGTRLLLDQAPRTRIRAESREIFREAVFLWRIPFWALRISSGWALRKAASAADLSPEEIASSTLRTKVRIRLRRALFMTVRRPVTRAAFFADLVLAIVKTLSKED
jgi:hypothetical protein